MGGMAAFVPNRKDPVVTESALAKVREDKQRESRDGFDGTWVAHPDLVPVAMDVFRAALGDRPNQKDRLREDVRPDAGTLADTRIDGAKVTEPGVRNNVNVAIQYLASWLSGTGAAAIFNLMEDVATAEISRSQLWQWTHNAARLDDGRPVTPALYRQIRAEELQRLEAGGQSAEHLREAAEILDALVESADFPEFLTYLAYPKLEERHAPARS
jgi:malate synthase